MVEKSGENVVRVDGMRMARGRTARFSPDLRIDRIEIVGPTGYRGAGMLWRPSGFGGV